MSGKFPALLICLLAAACAGPMTVRPTDRAMPTWSTMTYTTSRGPMLLEVKALPAGFDRAQIAALAARAMSFQVLARPFPFTTDPAQAPQPRNRVVIALSPPPTADGDDLCGPAPLASHPAGGRMEVLASFCAGDTPYSTVEGWAPLAPNSSVNAALAPLLAQIARELFGNNDEERQQRQDDGDWQM